MIGSKLLSVIMAEAVIKRTKNISTQVFNEHRHELEKIALGTNVYIPQSSINKLTKQVNYVQRQYAVHKYMAKYVAQQLILITFKAHSYKEFSLKDFNQYATCMIDEKTIHQSDKTDNIFDFVGKQREQAQSKQSRHDELLDTA